MAAVCEFDSLFTKSVPQILEKIFFFLDCKSFVNCLEVSRSWNVLLTSESFQRKGKPIFCEAIREELMQAAEKGTAEWVRKIMSSGMVDFNYLNKMNETPLHRAARCGHKDVVKLILDLCQLCQLNKFLLDKWTPLHCAAKEGHKDVG